MRDLRTIGRVLLASVVLAVVASGCMPASYRHARRLEGRYDVGDPGEGWKRVSPGGADNAWYNASLGASIYTDSTCGPRYVDAEPADLATELEAGLRERATLKDEVVTIEGRAGVQRVHRGLVDGVPVQVATTVVNKDYCTYDFAMIGNPDAFDAGWPAYQDLLSGFRAP